MKRSREGEQSRDGGRVCQDDGPILTLPTLPRWDSLSAQTRQLCEDAMALFDDHETPRSKSAKLVPHASIAPGLKPKIDSSIYSAPNLLTSRNGCSPSTPGPQFVPSILPPYSSSTVLHGFGPWAGYVFPAVNISDGAGSSLTLPAGSETVRPRATLDEASVVLIFQARPSKARRRDLTLSQRLAQHCGVTAKAVRDIWNMRTWRSVTRPYWNAAELQAEDDATT